jgi:hypothetical protein
MPKIKPKFKTYSLIEDAVERGLSFALNRLEDAGVYTTDEQRESVFPAMRNEIMVALAEIIIFDN